MSNVFDPKLLERIKADKPRYTIGIDCYDKDKHSYCLCRIQDKKMEFLLAKTLSPEEFKEEVENLSKYFNAVIYKNTP